MFCIDDEISKNSKFNAKNFPLQTQILTLNEYPLK